MTTPDPAPIAAKGRVRYGRRTAGYSNRGGIYQQPIGPPDTRAAVRALYEGEPGATCESVSKEAGIPVGTIRRWKSESNADGAPWKSIARSITNLPGRAGALADSFKVKMSELGRPMDDKVAVAEASREVSVDNAITIRAAVLDRHRKEWSAPRKLAYDAIATSATNLTLAFEKAKLAKITSETLQIIQVGECRAFGLNHDSRGQDGGTVVLVERSDTPADHLPPLPLGDPLGDGGEF